MTKLEQLKALVDAVDDDARRPALALAFKIVEAAKEYRDAIDADEGLVPQVRRRWTAGDTLDALLAELEATE